MTKIKDKIDLLRAAGLRNLIYDHKLSCKSKSNLVPLNKKIIHVKKTITLLFAALLSQLTIFSQTTWNWNTLVPAVSFTFYGLEADAGQYILHTDRYLVQVEPNGVFTGVLDLRGMNQFQTSIMKQYDTGNGNPYFLLARRSPTSSTSYTLAEYRPGTGVVNEITIQDNLGTFTGLRPTLLEQPDGSILVIGRDAYRKMSYSPSTGFNEIWARPLNRTVNHVLQDNNRLVMTEPGGIGTALDDNGNVLWTQNFGISTLWRTAKASNGYLFCGQGDTGAIIIRTDANGVELWRKETADKAFHSIIATQDGGIAAVGISANDAIVLARFDAAGNPLWQKEYGAGTGIRVIEDADGSFVIAARVSNTAGARLIRTDANGQAPGNEPAIIHSRRIRNDDLDVTVGPGASIFSNEYGAAFFSTPDSAATIYSVAPWISGLDAGGNLHLAASTYASLNSDFKTGPSNSQAADFNKVWLVTREQVSTLRRDYGADKEVDHLIPYDILTWPAKGNAYYQYNLDFLPVSTDRNLFPAPFVDVDGDGMYEPYKGDYPEIKGDIMIWSVMNDDTLHTASGGAPLSVEIQVAVYYLDCQENDAIGKSLFADYTVINRSTEDYSGTYMGFFTDLDLGCYWDDYVGSLPDAGACYVYNSTAQDNNCADVSGFGAGIPVQSVSFLNQSMDYAMHFYNVPNPVNVSPATAQIFYNYMTSRWSDGTYLTRGGSGNNPGSTDVTPFAFPDNPKDVQGWSMCTANLPFGERLMVPSHGPFDFPSGDTFNIKIGFTLHPNIAHPCPDIFNAVQPTLEQIRAWNGAGALDALPDLGQVQTLQPGQNLTLNAGIPGAQAYQWSNGASSQSITVSQPGAYAVTVTAATGCKIEEEVLVQLSTSTQDKNPLPDWTIRPNPSSEYAWIECRECPSGNSATRIVVRNAQGKTIAQLESADVSLRLDTANWPVGLYWLELWKNNRYLGARKLSVVR
jgi:hypothetical protein